VNLSLSDPFLLRVLRPIRFAARPVVKLNPTPPAHKKSFQHLRRMRRDDPGLYGLIALNLVIILMGTILDSSFIMPITVSIIVPAAANFDVGLI